MKGGNSSPSTSPGRSGSVVGFAGELSPVDNRPRRDHAEDMASSDRVQRALAAASALSTEERAELIGELILGLERERDPEPGYDEAWSAEIRRRVDAVVGGASKGAPWSQVKSEIAAQLAARRRRSA
jgi:putative addiction module component (TIGR02574 family)